MNVILASIFSHEIQNARHLFMSFLNDSLTKKNDKPSMGQGAVSG
jgi:hypothetical protein